MAVWWLFVLEFQFSSGGYRFKLQAVAKRTLSHFLCIFLVAVLMAVRFQLLCISMRRVAGMDLTAMHSNKMLYAAFCG
jgi:Mn2+/Fe2+ NRAMP family transporter